MTSITIITGASRGLGRNTALSIARRGGDVIITYRSGEAEAREVIAQIEALGRRAVAIRLDVGDVTSFPAFAQAVRAAITAIWNRDSVDHLVNNAGHGEMASFAETALRDTSIIQNMFIDNGDNTYTVRLYHNGVADFVTVDKQLPVSSRGTFGFADVGASYTNANNELWTALAEKAVVEAQASWGSANAYKSISGGYVGVGLGDITGHAYTVGNSLNFNSAVTAWNSGMLMGIASMSKPASASVVGNHAYAFVGYNPTTYQFTLFNPWGINNGYAPGLLTMTWSQIQANFSYYDTAVA